MKIGIITIHFPYNYGAMLQAHALQKYLFSVGYKNEIIDFRPYSMDNVYHIRFEKIIHHPITFFKELISKIVGRRRKFNGFNKFLENDLTLSNKTFSNINLHNKIDYDCIISGSDQIWNPGITRGCDEYLLSFVPNSVRKIAYASSFGVDQISNETENHYKKFLSKFDYLSSREHEGVSILNKITGKTAIKVCDPVFLLNKDYWIKMMSKVENVDYDFLLLYSLENNDQLNLNAKKIADEFNLKIISIHPFGKKNEYSDINLDNVGPKEFLWLINNAKYVCSNSFHGISFSIIFGKKFVPFIHSQTGSRVKNLISQFEINSEIMSLDDTHIEIFCVDDNSNKQMDGFIENSKSYLLNSLTNKL